MDSTHVTSYEYDNLHRLRKVIYADGTYETVAYRTDDLPDLFKAFDEVGTELFTIDHQYDAAKNKTAELYTHNPVSYFTGLTGKAWTHDSLGRVTNSYAVSKHPLYPQRDYVAHTGFTYDSLGRVLTENQDLQVHENGSPTLLHAHTITSTWDAFGGKESTSSTEGNDPTGLQIQRQFDAAHRLKQVQEVRSLGDSAMSAILRWQGAAGRLSDITHWNGSVTGYGQYDARGRVGEIRTETGTGGLLAGRAFGYSPASTRSRELKLGQVGADYVFEHDVFDRLVNVRKGTWNPGTGDLSGTVNVASRTFDGANSMLLLEEGIEGSPLTQTSAQTDVTNAFTTFGGLSVLRDKRGNTIQIGNEFLVYDVLGHLVGLTDDINAPINIWYEVWDAEDRRIYRTDFTGDRAFIWDGQALLQEKDLSSGQVDREYLTGPGVDQVIGQRISGVPFAFHTDNLSTPYAATDSTGAVAEFYDIEPFGQMTVTAGTASQPLRSAVGLHGGWYDHDTGRTYFRQRVYDPRMARFLSRDALGVWGDVLNLGNPYGFVANAPTLLRDPSGLKIWIVVSSFGNYAGYTKNSSQAVAAEVAKNLAKAGALTESLSLDVVWNRAQDQVRGKIADIRNQDPEARIVWLALGQHERSGIELETQARNERGQYVDNVGYIPQSGDMNDSREGAPATRYASNIARGIAGDLGISTDTNAGGYLCGSVAYELFRQEDIGRIEHGTFIHLPKTLRDDQVRDFGKKAADLFGPKGDLDQDGRINRLDNYPGRPKPNARDCKFGGPDLLLDDVPLDEPIFLACKPPPRSSRCRFGEVLRFLCYCWSPAHKILAVHRILGKLPASDLTSTPRAGHSSSSMSGRTCG